MNENFVSMPCTRYIHRRHCLSVANDTQCDFCHTYTRKKNVKRNQIVRHRTETFPTMHSTFSFLRSIKSPANVNSGRCDDNRIRCNFVKFKSHLSALLSESRKKMFSAFIFFNEVSVVRLWPRFRRKDTTEWTVVARDTNFRFTFSCWAFSTHRLTASDHRTYHRV